MEPPHARSLKGDTLPSGVRAVCNRGLDVSGLIEGEIPREGPKMERESLFPGAPQLGLPTLAS